MGVPYGSAGREDPAMTMSAAEARALVEAVTGRPGYTSAVGTRVLLAEPGTVHLALPRRADLLQFSGFFHGGVVAGLADHAAGGAVTTLMPSGRIGVTVDLAITFLAPADGGSLVAMATALHVGSTLATATVTIETRDGDGSRVCAFAIVTLRAVAIGNTRHT
jgi:uncharacterized protein (TIGR00369 family)